MVLSHMEKKIELQYYTEYIEKKFHPEVDPCSSNLCAVQGSTVLFSKAIRLSPLDNSISEGDALLDWAHL